jgi:hypothetical protein
MLHNNAECSGMLHNNAECSGMLHNNAECCLLFRNSAAFRDAACCMQQQQCNSAEQKTKLDNHNSHKDL